ncbi:unnamed protein product [Zymoseptoria tritici ST99CH_1E4]|uniref:TLC domain-containing protein n=1 Tax=Zymoseptoria tritici ST99CH_1E4 TaxID=1276532 RepID=A0A2H1GAB9_ZYMTR|nr:unnamed protein product [Zymoseptoria tritici ST99CH_1E4]
MKDPFPIAPPEALINLTQPIATALSLPTLPLHVHEVIFAFFFYNFVNVVLSPWLSRTFFPSTYTSFNRRTRINWDVHVVSFFQSVIICALSLYVIWFDEERKETRPREAWEPRIWEYSGLSGLLQSFALGYFLWDFIMCTVHVDIFGWGMLAHAISALSVFALGYRPFIYFYAPVFLLYELSSPFLNIHWFCDKLKLTGSIYQAINGAFLTFTFFACRIIWGNISSVYVFQDVYKGVFRGNTTPLSKPHHLADVPVSSYTAKDLLAIYNDEQGQRFAFAGQERFIPLWLGAIYLASNIVLNSLNIWWFGKMVQTIRSRFAPPFGTKGQAKEVHYEPKERVRMQGSPRQSEDEIKVHKVVEADGSRGIEMEGQRTLRTRRKA